MTLSRLILGHDDRGVEAKKINKDDDFPDARPGDVVFTGFVGVARGNVFWQGGDHLFVASPQYLFTGRGSNFYGLEINLPVGTPVEVVWTGKVFQVNKLDVRAEYSFDLLEFLRDDYAWCEDLDLPYTKPDEWTRVWHLASAPEPWAIMHKLLFVEIAEGCPDDQFGWEQSVAPQQVLVLEGALYQTLFPGEEPIKFGAGKFLSSMGGAVQHVRTDPNRRTRFLAFFDGPQYTVEAPKHG